MPPQKLVETAFPLIDADPHAARVVRYMRGSDYATWTIGTVAPPAAIYLWDIAEPTKTKLKAPMKVAGVVGFLGGFLLAYQRSSFRLWGWSENQQEAARDLAELRQKAQEGTPLYGESDQPEWIQTAAYRNSAWSQLKFQAFPMFNFVNHPHHGTNAATYTEPKETES